jgi:hypothetical protein
MIGDTYGQIYTGGALTLRYVESNNVGLFKQKIESLDWIRPHTGSYSYYIHIADSIKPSECNGVSIGYMMGNNAYH